MPAKKGLYHNIHAKRKRDELERAEKNESVTEASFNKPENAVVLFSNQVEDLATEEEIVEKTNKEMERLSKIVETFIEQGKSEEEIYEIFEKGTHYQIINDNFKTMFDRTFDKLLEFRYANDIKFYKVNVLAHPSSYAQKMNSLAHYLRQAGKDLIEKNKLQALIEKELAAYLINGRVVFINADVERVAVAYNSQNKPVRIKL